ncbi:putative siderophore transport system permease protein YfiZ [Paenibacillus solanacearum]|uniref:Siderophore transport system permease protein YfiZ n=1 Tax=Paenibacillus solanacearum TaxID=2048548 RepID=A0A916K9Y1_9BACL|nr:iron ABC transporter permease [Paenibacillus solanacearum]CAG7648603.1 putative siderophore transport system permease protein YfiZ [Paenibacillus solanacearum]
MANMPLEKQNRTWFLLFLFSASTLALAAGMLLSLKWGPAKVSWTALFEALSYRNQGNIDLYIQTLRLPRTLAACIVGIQLALAGLLTQLATKNPLASPHVFGINAGASLAVVFGLVTFTGMPLLGSMALAFCGAAGGALLVWLLSGSEHKQYIRLALGGIAVHFLLSSFTECMIIFNQYSTDSMMFWLVGSVSQAGWSQVQAVLPFFLGGLLLLLIMLPAFRLLLLEDDVAAGLGQRIGMVRAAGLIFVIVMAGSAVAICGPIGFVCLIVPHIARALVGSRLTLLVPLTGLLGGALLVYADVLSRMIAFPFESPVGIVTSAIGGPFFIYLARKKGGAGR